MTTETERLDRLEKIVALGADGLEPPADPDAAAELTTLVDELRTEVLDPVEPTDPNEPTAEQLAAWNAVIDDLQAQHPEWTRQEAHDNFGNLIRSLEESGEI